MKQKLITESLTKIFWPIWAFLKLVFAFLVCFFVALFFAIVTFFKKLSKVFQNWWEKLRIWENIKKQFVNIYKK